MIVNRTFILSLEYLLKFISIEAVIRPSVPTTVPKIQNNAVDKRFYIYSCRLGKFHNFL